MELLSRLPRILRESIRKTTNENVEEAYEKFTKGSDPVKYFYKKGLEALVGNKVLNHTPTTISDR